MQLFNFRGGREFAARGAKGFPVACPAHCCNWLAACAALAGRHVLPFCYWLWIGFLFSVRLGAAEKIFILCKIKLEYV
jgi:hypothetical protein